MLRSKQGKQSKFYNNILIFISENMEDVIQKRES